MLLITIEKDGKYLIRESKELIPVVKLSSLSDIRGEMTGITVFVIHY